MNDAIRPITVRLEEMAADLTKVGWVKWGDLAREASRTITTGEEALSVAEVALSQALARADAAEDRMKVLEEALSPFAQISVPYELYADYEFAKIPIPAKFFHAARAALAKDLTNG